MFFSSLTLPKASYQMFFIDPSFYRGKTCCHYPRVIGVPSRLVSFSSSSAVISSGERNGKMSVVAIDIDGATIRLIDFQTRKYQFGVIGLGLGLSERAAAC